MPGKSPEYEKLTAITLVMAGAVLAVNLYYYAFPVFINRGFTPEGLIHIMTGLRKEGLFSSVLKTKIIAAVLIGLGGILRTGKSTHLGWPFVLTMFAIGTPIYLIGPESTLLKALSPLLHVSRYGLYIATTAIGASLIAVGFFILSRKFKKDVKPTQMEDSFDQCTELIDDHKYSINLETRFSYGHKIHKGWINIINPFRATVIMGTPGAGKSYSVFEPIIEQSTLRGYSMFVYDYKYPSLSEIVYNELKHNIDHYDVTPRFGVINFKDPRYSNRCNPLRPEYITDPADTTEIAELVMQNVNKAAVEKEDFFSMSAKVYLDALLWYLRKYKPEGKPEGAYCSFPHVIELMGCDYKKVFDILKDHPDLQVKISPFTSALEGGAQDQLQGQIASAQIPLNKFISPALYWVLSENEINLDINNPQRPMILCMGNDPERQTIYSTTLALFTAQMFKIINKKGKRHSVILLDELPTIFLKGLDNLIATARSNLVAIFLGVQDKSQLKRDYGDKESTVILNTVGNHIIGQVSGETAKEYSQMFGKQKRENRSTSLGEESDSVSISYHEEDIMPVSAIETMSQGEFLGKVADNNTMKIEKKFFHGEIQRPPYDELQRQRKARGWSDIPMINDFDKDEIRQDIEENFDDYLYDYCKEEFIRENPQNYNQEETVLQSIIKDRVAQKKQQAAEIKVLKEEIFEKKWLQHVDELRDENFRRIKAEITELVEKEYMKVLEKKNAKSKELKEKKDNDLIKKHVESLRAEAARKNTAQGSVPAPDEISSTREEQIRRREEVSRRRRELEQQNKDEEDL